MSDCLNVCLYFEYNFFPAKMLGASRDYPHVLDKIHDALRLVEKCSEIIHLGMVVITPACSVLPNAFISLYLYYVKYLGCDAFRMTDETWS